MPQKRRTLEKRWTLLLGLGLLLFGTAAARAQTEEQARFQRMLQEIFLVFENPTPALKQWLTPDLKNILHELPLELGPMYLQEKGVALDILHRIAKLANHDGTNLEQIMEHWLPTGDVINVLRASSEDGRFEGRVFFPRDGYGGGFRTGPRIEEFVVDSRVNRAHLTVTELVIDHEQALLQGRALTRVGRKNYFRRFFEVPLTKDKVLDFDHFKEKEGFIFDPLQPKNGKRRVSSYHLEHDWIPRAIQSHGGKRH